METTRVATEKSDRIVALDILRGIALFGMILVHFHQRMEKPATGAEDIVGWVIWMGVETKAWATFAFLFGAGFAILMRRAEARGLDVVPVFLRRMAALAVIGLAVQLLFGFRILLDYAIWGVPLLLVRNWPTRSLLALAFCAATAGSVYGIVRPAIVTTTLGRTRAEVVMKEDRERAQEHWRALRVAEDSATFAQAVKERASHARWMYLRARALIPDSNLVLFILGLLAIRLGVFDDPRRNHRIIVSAIAFGIVSWAAAWFVLPRLPEETRIGPIQIYPQTGIGIVSDQWLAFTYIGAVILLLAHRPVWSARLRSFGIAGRMALTNYVLQAALLSVLASGYGFALRIRPYYDLPATILLFGFCVAVSRLWLARFNYGPLERMWRWVTYAEWRRSVQEPLTTV